jgi:hypothetical protein
MFASIGLQIFELLIIGAGCEIDLTETLKYLDHGCHTTWVVHLNLDGVLHFCGCHQIVAIGCHIP